VEKKADQEVNTLGIDLQPQQVELHVSTCQAMLAVSCRFALLLYLVSQALGFNLALQWFE
jgi:hypothetical protein